MKQLFTTPKFLSAKPCFAAALAALLLAAGLTGCGSKAKYRTLDEIKESGELTMYTDARFAPFEYVSEGSQVSGVDADIGQAIADALGVELKIVNGDFDGLALQVANGQCDMAIAAVTITPERQETMDFSTPYTNACQYIIVQEDNDSITCFDDLAGQKIGVQLGTTGDIQVSNEITDGILTDTGAQVVQYKTLQEGCLALANGQLGAVVVDDLSAKNYCIVNDGLKCFEALYKDGSIQEELYGVAVAKGNTQLLEQINQVVEQLVSEGKIDEFLDYHIQAATITQ